MKRKVVYASAAVLAVFGFSTVQAGGFIGNLGRTLDQGQTAMTGGLDIGTRELEPDSGSNADLDVRSFNLRLTHGFGSGVELYGRISPMTMVWDFDDTDFSPNILSLGAGLQWSPPMQTGPVSWGLGAGFDWGTGDDQDTDIDFTEITLAGGVGYALNPTLDLYGGLDFVFTNATIDPPGPGDADFSEDTPVGIFGGLNYRFSPSWAWGAELRLINEQVVSLLARYSFGAPNQTPHPAAHPKPHHY